MSGEEDTNHEIAVEVSDLHDIIRTPGGRRFISSLLIEAGYFNDTYSSDVEKMKHNTSKRSVGVWLVEQAKQADEDHFLQLLKENFTDDN